MNNTTNHVTNALFTKKNEERVVAAIEKLVDHITSPEALADKEKIKLLEYELGVANAKLSQRF